MEKFKLDEIQEMEIRGGLDSLDMFTGFRKNPLVLAWDSSLGAQEFRMLLILNDMYKRLPHKKMIKEELKYYMKEKLNIYEDDFEKTFENLDNWLVGKTGL